MCSTLVNQPKLSPTTTMWITDVRKNNYSTVAAINYSTAAATTSATSPPSGRSGTTNGVTGMPFWRPSLMHIPRGDGADVMPILKFMVPTQCLIYVECLEKY